MPRRNHRREQYEPLDLTPADVNKAAEKSPEAKRSIAERRAAAAERQKNARINRGIDWTVCLIPGCGAELFNWTGRAKHDTPLLRDHRVKLPLCIDHLSVAYQQATFDRNDPLLVEANTLLLERREAKRKELQKDWLNQSDGHIYFVRLNGLVKVGWSRDVDERLRAYGPDVEVIVIYPGTRNDETHLHRQLRPALARGREWYEDGPIVADFAAQALAKHGAPEVFTAWTRPKQVIRPRRKRSA